MRLIFTAFLFLFHIVTVAQNRVTISGFVREKGSQEQLPGVNVYIDNTPYGAVTNTYGFYSLTVPVSDSATVSFSFVGYEKQQKRVALRTDTELNIFLPTITQLEEVVVSAERSK